LILGQIFAPPPQCPKKPMALCELMIAHNPATHASVQSPERYGPATKDRWWRGGSPQAGLMRESRGFA
jgi:hypothetical protein